MESIDSELIELLERKAPEHLTIEEIEQLSARLDKSPDLQMFLLEQLQMEQYLAAALSRIDVRVDEIIAGRKGRAAPSAEGPRKFGLAAALMLLVCGLVAAGGVVWYRAGRVVPVVAVGKPGEESAKGVKSEKGQEAEKGAVVMPDAVVKSSAQEKEQGTGQESAKGPKGAGEGEKGQESVKSDEGAKSEKREIGAKEQGADAPRSPVGEAKVKTALPWEAALGAAPQAWNAVVLAPPPSRGMALSGVEAGQWLEPAGAFSKLRAPWPADAMLRLRVPLRGSCELRLWKGNEGAVFQLAGNAGWSSYHALREAAAPQGEPKFRELWEPKLRELWETDDGLYWKFHSVEITDFRKARGKIHFNRTVHPNDTTVDLFWHDGVVQLWRGDLRLCSAPLPGPPDEVYLKQGGQLEHLSMVRMEKPPAQPRYVPALALDSAQPAALAWNRQATAPATIENVADGGLKITAPEGAQPAKVWLALPKPGICDVVLKVQGATHGSGVYLGGPDGTPIVGALLVESAWPGHNDVALQNPWEGAAAAPGAVAAQAAPIWVRMLPASGVLKCWLSRDGLHWVSLGSKPLPFGGPPIASFGVYVAAGAKPPRGLTVRQVQVREYSGLNSLAPADLLTRAPAVASPNVQAWKQTAAQSLPAGVDRGAWHRAVALKTIASGAPLDVCSWLLRGLLKDAAQQPRSVEQNQRLLAEFPDVAQMTVAVLPWDGRSPQPMLADLVAAAGELAAVAQAEGEARPFAALGKQVVAARVGPFPELSYEFPDTLILPELMQLAATGRYDEMEETARTVQLYARDNVAHVAQWALELAARRRRGDKVSTPPLAGASQRQLLVDTTKAQQMFMDDLTEAARSGQMARASQLITYLEPLAPNEMFADTGDPMVYVSPATQISALMAQYPALGVQMKQTIADKGRLRVRFAIADNNLSKVMHAATQFAGTAAATEGYQWIGDQLLRGGDAVGALAWFERALPTADVAQRDQLSARVRLANAMLGRDFGSAVRHTVRLGDDDVTAEEFEKRVAAARKEARPVAVAAPQQAPAATGFRVEPLAAAPADRPWIGEGLALAATSDTLVAQDGRTVVAWDIAGNRPRWQLPLGDGSSVGWRPQFDGSNVVVTARAGNAAQLHRLDLATGQPRGKPASVAGACFAGYAPALRGNSALAFATRPHPTKPMLLLSAVDLASGELLRESPLLPRAAETDAATCPPLVGADAIVVFVDGGIVCCETAGVVRWVRRQYAVGGKENRAAAPPVPTQSLLVDDDAIVWQPGVPYIERIDLAQGRRKWMRMLPEIRRIIGVVDGQVIVESNQRVVALGAADGKLRWNKSTGDLLAPVAVGSPGGVLVTRAKVVRPADAGNPQPLLCPELVWLDPANGQMRGVWPLESLTGEHLALGPWTVSQGTIVTFFGAGKTGAKGGIQWDAARQLLRLVPQGSPQPPREDTGGSLEAGL